MIITVTICATIIILAAMVIVGAWRIGKKLGAAFDKLEDGLMKDIDRQFGDEPWMKEHKLLYHHKKEAQSDG